jgi:hypothetical protein
MSAIFTWTVAGWFLWISCFPAWAGEASVFRVLRVPAGEAVAVRSALLDPEVGAKEESLEDWIGPRRIDVLATFRQKDPWDGSVMRREESMGQIEHGGEILELGINLEMEGQSDRPELRYGIEVTLPMGAKKERFFQVLGITRKVRAGGWVERCCWSDGRDAVMLWEYPAASADEDPERLRPIVHVELRWFQAAEADGAKLGASGPETREKALKWLEGRVKLRREAVYDFQFGNPGCWMMSEGKHDPVNGRSISDDYFAIDTKGAEEGGRLKMEWKMTTAKGVKEESRSVRAEVEPGVWEFLPLKDDLEANMLACRVTKL